MALSIKRDANKTKDIKLKSYCSECKRETNQMVMQSVDVDASESYNDDDGNKFSSVDWVDHYQIVQCQGCDNITFRHQSWFSEAQDEGDDGTSVKLYPIRSDKFRVLMDHYYATPKIRRIYRETIECFNNESFTLCASGLRAIIEGICADKQIADGPVNIMGKNGVSLIKRKDNLEGKIAGLAEKKILTDSQAAVLHQHRFLGNNAIHELNIPSYDELKLALDIVEHILVSLYEMPRKAEELIQMKKIRMGNPQQGDKGKA